MSWAYLCSDLDSVARRGPELARQENRELVDAITARDESVTAVARDKARYHADMVAAERVHWKSYLAEALERRMRQDEVSDRWRIFRPCLRGRMHFLTVNRLASVALNTIYVALDMRWRCVSEETEDFRLEPREPE
jgi:hypothetical protein